MLSVDIQSRIGAKSLESRICSSLVKFFNNFIQRVMPSCSSNYIKSWWYLPSYLAHTLATLHAFLSHNFELILIVYAILSANVLRMFHTLQECSRLLHIYVIIYGPIVTSKPYGYVESFWKTRVSYTLLSNTETCRRGLVSSVSAY